MRYDLTPLFRSTVGFDGLTRLFDMAMKLDHEAPSYPPYNIEKTAEDSYRITMAVAGFAQGDITITAQDNVLLVAGKQQREEEGTDRTFLHRGIAARAFERRFQLAEHVKVRAAAMQDGLLHIDLQREVPEAAKPRTIPINGMEAGRVEQKSCSDSACG